MSTKDQKIKEFLQTKRAPLDEWNTHEQLCLASAVACSGDQNWMSVSRALKGIVFSYNSRPTDWFLSKSCATQYGKLLESVETPKRKKRTASEKDGSNAAEQVPSTPVESLVKKLTGERIIELKKAISEEQQQYAKLKEEIQFLQSSSMDETRIREMWNQIEQENIQKEREKVRHDQWLKDREEKKREHERQWRGPYKANIRPQKSQEEIEPDTTTASTSQQQAVSSHAHSAPTLIDLLDKKSTLTVPESSGGKEGDIVKDEEADILADFNEIIDCEKFDIDEDLEDLNSIIMNPEILDEKISDGEPIKDADDSSQATSTDDYDKLKIKQIVETIQGLAGDSEAVASTSSLSSAVGAVASLPLAIPEEKPEKVIAIAPSLAEESEAIQVPSETENSEPASVEMIEAPVESNDSTTLQHTKNESPLPEDKVVMISDESSNTNDNDKKEELSEKVDTNDESQSVKSGDEIKDASGEDSNKEAPAFQGLPTAESDENSESSEKEKESRAASTFRPLDDSDDAIFEDAREHHSGSDKLQVSDIGKEASPEKSLSEAPESKSSKTVIATESEEASRSAIDSDDEMTEIKNSRSMGRKKMADSLKADTPSSSTRSRDHSENDDNRDSTPIRTRSRHSSTAVSETKSTQIFPKEQDHNMWKARWEDCAKELQRLKDFSQVIDSRIMQDEHYKRICLQPMNMKMIGKNIESHVSTLKIDVERDFILMCSNIMMVSGNKGPKFEETVLQLIKDGREIIDSHMRVEESYKSYRKQIKKQAL